MVASATPLEDEHAGGVSSQVVPATTGPSSRQHPASTDHCFDHAQPEALKTEQVFLSYSRADRDASIALRAALEQAALSVYRDEDANRAGDQWLSRLEQTLEGCSAFVVLVGRDGVRRWVAAETHSALNRHFAAHEDDKRLPIFPVLLGDTAPETLPSFLRLFQATAWNGTGPLPAQLLDAIHARAIVANTALTVEGCPFVGLDAYRSDQAHLFFGRQQETLDALACFDTRRGHSTVRWLEINGNSGSGKSSPGARGDDIGFRVLCSSPIESLAPGAAER